jgi:REP element-mobilizing transposase RayT
MNRVNYFGKIDSGKMILSESGQIVHDNWKNLPTHFHYVELDSFVVMPNHFHAIILINHNQNEVKNQNSIHRKNENRQNYYSHISPKSGSLSAVIRSFKSSCTREINLRNPALSFNWQARFHDHIIRDRLAHSRIRNYIINNPQKWFEDSFNR